jgi:myo-inositol-1(or 4)-monophosphatase
VDKKSLLRKSLAKIMVDHISSIESLVNIHTSASTQIKSDGSPVTALDFALSELIEEIAKQEMSPDLTFYSEEKFCEWKFPLLALDPLDGTKEFIAKRHEWAISLAVLPTQKFSGEGWVYNPMTKECFTEEEAFAPNQKKQYQGEVSRSEWEQGLFEGKSTSKFKFIPMGSIAYKLGRLSAGKTDFVVSLRPKNIWDIAGGTLLCQKSGIKFYSAGKEVTQVQKLYEPPLIWCHEKLFFELSAHFS